MSLTNNKYHDDVNAYGLKAGDKVKLKGSSHTYKIKKVVFKPKPKPYCDIIEITFEDGKMAGYSLSGEVFYADEFKYFHDITKTIRNKKAIISKKTHNNIAIIVCLLFLVYMMGNIIGMILSLFESINI